jgi:hypothetical protein
MAIAEEPSVGSVPVITADRKGEHSPKRPTWRCETCGVDWPCADARGRLTAEFAVCPTASLVYLAMCQSTAVLDLWGTESKINLADRFSGWLIANSEHSTGDE